MADMREPLGQLLDASVVVAAVVVAPVVVAAVIVVGSERERVAAP